MKNLIKKSIIVVTLLITVMTHASNAEIEAIASKLSTNESFHKYCLNVTAINAIRLYKLSFLSENEQKENIEKLTDLSSKLSVLSESSKEEFATLAGFSSFSYYELLANHVDNNIKKIKESLPELELLNKDDLNAVFEIAASKWSLVTPPNEKLCVDCLHKAREKHEKCNNRHTAAKWGIYGLGGLVCVIGTAAGLILTAGSASSIVAGVGAGCAALVLSMGSANESSNARCDSTWSAEQSNCLGLYGVGGGCHG